MTLFVQAIIHRPRVLCIAFGRDHDSRSVFVDIGKDFFCTICLITKQVAACKICFIHKINGMSRVVVVAGRQQENDRITQPVYNGMYLCIQAAFCTPDGLIFRFFPHH